MNEKYLIGILIVLGLFTTVAGLAQVSAVTTYYNDDGVKLFIKHGSIEDGSYVLYAPGGRDIFTTELNIDGTQYQVEYYKVAIYGMIVDIDVIGPVVNNTTEPQNETPEVSENETNPVENTTVTHNMPERNPDEKYVMATGDDVTLPPATNNSVENATPNNDTSEIAMENAGNGIIPAIIAVIVIIGAVIYIRRKV